MNKIIIAGFLLAFCSAAKAAEYPRNPDRFPSIGFNFGGNFESGDATVKSGSFKATQDLEITNGILSVDLRLPISNNVTINGALGLSGSTSDATETNLLTGGETDTSGVAFNIGLRFYIH